MRRGAGQKTARAVRPGTQKRASARARSGRRRRRCSGSAAGGTAGAGRNGTVRQEVARQVACSHVMHRGRPPSWCRSAAISARWLFDQRVVRRVNRARGVIHDVDAEVSLSFGRLVGQRAPGEIFPSRTLCALLVRHRGAVTGSIDRVASRGGVRGTDLAMFARPVTFLATPCVVSRRSRRAKGLA